MQYPPNPYGNPGPNDQTTSYGQPTYPYQQQEQPLYENRYMGFWIKVYPSHVEFKAGMVGTQSIPLTQIAGIQPGMMGVLQIILETTGGQKYAIPTNKKREVQQAISDAQARTATSYQQQSPHTPVQPQYQRQPSSWWRRQKRITKVGILGCGLPTAILFLCICSLTMIGLANPSQQQTSSQTANVAPQSVPPTHASLRATATPKPTPTPRPTPTPTPVPPTPTPTPVQQVQPTTPPAPTSPPAPSCDGTTVDGICYDTNANGGTLVYSPAADFCNYFYCVTTFWTDTAGYVAECANGKYTHSGGVSGACSRDGGVLAPVYSH